MSEDAVVEAASNASAHAALEAVRAKLEARVSATLRGRPDEAEQRDHLHHIGARLRWLYARERQRILTGNTNSLLPPPLDAHDQLLADILVLVHDIGKWVPREALRAWTGAELDAEHLRPIFDQLQLSPNQRDLFLLGVGRRLALAQDGYLTEYDSVHHLVSAFMLVADPELGFDQLAAADREHLIAMVIGHQYGAYFKEHLLALSLQDKDIRTGMLVDVSRPERLKGDPLGSAFHDADIADLLFVGSLEQSDPGRETAHFHAGGLIKILLINLGHYVLGVARGPKRLKDCFQSTRDTLQDAIHELITPSARAESRHWQATASEFLDRLESPDRLREMRQIIAARGRTKEASMTALRTLIYDAARAYLESQPPDAVPASTA